MDTWHAQRQPEQERRSRVEWRDGRSELDYRRAGDAVQGRGGSVPKLTGTGRYCRACTARACFSVTRGGTTVWLS